MHVYIPGHLNYVADAASRSHEPDKFSAPSSFLQSYWYHSSRRFQSNAGVCIHIVWEYCMYIDI